MPCETAPIGAASFRLRTCNVSSPISGDGLTAGLEIGEEDVSVEGGADSVEVPIGPFLVTGSLEDWLAMVERELTQLEPGMDHRDPACDGLAIASRLPSLKVSRAT